MKISLGRGARAPGATEQPSLGRAAVADNTLRIVYEMTISHSEFFRTLPAVMGALPYVVDGSEVSSVQDTRRLKINLSPEGRRNFGPIPLPVTHVELGFDGYREEEAKVFLARFNNYYRRGGG